MFQEILDPLLAVGGVVACPFQGDLVSPGGDPDLERFLDQTEGFVVMPGHRLERLPVEGDRFHGPVRVLLSLIGYRNRS